MATSGVASVRHTVYNARLMSCYFVVCGVLFIWGGQWTEAGDGVLLRAGRGMPLSSLQADTQQPVLGRPCRTTVAM